MPWLTHLIGKRIRDPEGRTIGVLRELVAEQGRFPRITKAIIDLRSGGRAIYESADSSVVVPWEALNEADGFLKLSAPGLRSAEEGWELQVRQSLLDRQIVDIEGARVVRVNDVWLSESAGHLRVVAVDVGFRGILRQLGFENLFVRLAEALGYEIGEKLISWNYVEPLEERKGDVRLTVSSRLLRELHPSELADILDQLSPDRRERILTLMSDKALAETLAETEPGTSREAVELLGEERVRRVLEIMPPDEAADLLGDVGYERAERLLNLIGVRQASVLRELLGYPPDSAGGRMTPSFVAVRAGVTCDEAIAAIRREADKAETIYYAYVLDDEGRLKGVMSLRELLRAAPARSVVDLMETDIVSAHVTDDQEEVARNMARYDLLSIPVVDEAGRLRGIVTVDDIVDVFEEEASEDLSEVTGVYLGEGPQVQAGRLAGFGLALVAGIISALLLATRRPVLLSVTPVAWLLPLYLRMAQDLGTWSLAKSLSDSDLDARRRWDALAQELLTAMASAAAAGVLVGAFGTWWSGHLSAGALLGIGIFVGMLSASLIGLSLPSIVKTFRLNRLLQRGRPLAVVVGMASLLVYVWSLSSLALRLS